MRERKIISWREKNNLLREKKGLQEFMIPVRVRRVGTGNPYKKPKFEVPREVDEGADHEDHDQNVPKRQLR